MHTKKSMLTRKGRKKKAKQSERNTSKQENLANPSNKKIAQSNPLELGGPTK
jgi:hypothetical protein